MDGFGFSDASSAVRKKRTSTIRRPRCDAQPPSEYQDFSSLSSTPPSDNVSKVSSDENNGYGSVSRKKEVSLILCSSRASSANFADSKSAQNMPKHEDGGFGESDEASNNGSFRGSNEQRHTGADSRRFTEGVLAPANWKNTSSMGQFGVVSDEVGQDHKVRKVKLKVGGMTRTINAKSPSDGASAVGSSSTKSSRFPDYRQKAEENLDDNHSFNSDRGRAVQGVLWKDIPRSVLSVRKSEGMMGRMPDENLSSKQMDTYEAVRKSKRVPKKRVLDGVLDDADEDDDEIRYLEKVKTSKITAHYGPQYDDEEEGGSRKQRKLSRVMKRNVDGLYDADVDHGSSRLVKEGKKSKSGRVLEDTDYVEEEEAGSDGDLTTKRKKMRKESVELVGDSKNELKITTRQRALQSGKDVTSGFGANLVEFPNGLPPAPPKKQKEKLSEVEQQLKRAEALQRRRMQVEKAARESEAEAIRKILGQDSNRKKREDKMKKRQEVLAQEKAANAKMLASNHVRLVMGPSGTVVTFPDELGLPSIFDSGPCSYPPPRGKCAGPLCNKPYKYRDSKSNLPLCSLQCYKAVHEKTQPLTAC